MQPQNPTKLIKEKIHQTVYKLDGRPSTWRVVVDELKNRITIEGDEFSVNDEDADFRLHLTKEEAQELAYLLTEATKEPELYRLQPAAVGSEFAVAVVDCLSNKTIFYLIHQDMIYVLDNSNKNNLLFCATEPRLKHLYPAEVTDLVTNFVEFCIKENIKSFYKVEEILQMWEERCNGGKSLDDALKNFHWGKHTNE